ncbi:DUF7344 domain-containing protein [Halorussus marinus]|uniref:DUF7344 domain-containing protein n=1 Tax=Halorussus marinus TaxID=2505976 RepID=UPI001ADC2715|nr:hypothetical protein [Halorussus marinus]
MSKDGFPDGGGANGPTTPREAVSQFAHEQSIATAKLDSLFGILANGQRRQILAYLVETDDGVATLPELADRIADGEDPERATLRLHHNHLPKLEDEGFVEYDARSETVRYRGSQAVTAWVEFARR